MTAVSLDDFDHDSHMRRAFALASEAAERGDEPFGSVLVRDDEIVREASNRIVTEDDIRRHPELHLAHLAVREMTPEERAETVMYTSTEPCPMCAGGMATAGFARVVYSVGADDLAVLTGGTPSVRAADVLSDRTDVVGPVLLEEGLTVHESYGW
ncbi:nucleoside deaminase [Halovivax asiaticus]|uniref:nucleoside deaminase n=1 Tax=Halovivax asiaticus TaxID=332953 RepID=UPI000A066D6C|nr:nucleoside deaminase [Halovivax asiaticus]